MTKHQAHNGDRRARKLKALHQQRSDLEALIAEVELNTVLRVRCEEELKEVQRRIYALEQIGEAAYA